MEKKRGHNEKESGFNRVISIAKQVKSVWALLPGSIAAAVTGYLAYVAALSPLLLWLTILGSFACGLIIWVLLENRRARRIGFGLLSLLAVGLIGFSLWQKQQKVERYTLAFSDFNARRTTVTANDGSTLITGVQIIMLITNTSDRPIYFQTRKHLTRVAGRDSGIYGEELDKVREIMPNGMYTIVDDPIAINPTPALNGFEGDVDFQIAYGRERNALRKTLKMTGPIHILFLADGSPHAVLFAGNDVQ